LDCKTTRSFVKSTQQDHWYRKDDGYICKNCYSKMLYIQNFERENERHKAYYKNHKKDSLLYQAVRNRKLRLTVLGHYSNDTFTCACCGEGHIEFLAIDHINGGGAKQRKTGLRSSMFWLWLIKNNYPLGYRVLCHNCNQATGNFKYCPHEKERENQHVTKTL